PVLVDQPECADGQLAGGHLSVRAQPLHGLAVARLGWRAFDLGGDLVAQHRGACAHGQGQGELLMADNQAQVRMTEVPPPVAAGAKPALRTHMASALPARAEQQKAESQVKVEIKTLDFYYGEYKALKSISLPLHDRRVTAFIGPSGCGKSTLLRVLNRIYAL